MISWSAINFIINESTNLVANINSINKSFSFQVVESQFETCTKYLEIIIIVSLQYHYLRVMTK